MYYIQFLTSTDVKCLFVAAYIRIPSDFTDLNIRPIVFIGDGLVIKLVSSLTARFVRFLCHTLEPPYKNSNNCILLCFSEI